MAGFDFEIPDNILSDINCDDIAEEMINEALPIYEKSVRKELAPHKDTGELLDHLKIKQATRTKTDAYIGYLTAEGEKDDGFRNYQKALAIEYGNSHETARPFMQSAVDRCENAVLDKMQEVYNRRVK